MKQSGFGQLTPFPLKWIYWVEYSQKNEQMNFVRLFNVEKLSA